MRNRIDILNKVRECRESAEILNLKRLFKSLKLLTYVHFP